MHEELQALARKHHGVDDDSLREKWPPLIEKLEKAIAGDPIKTAIAGAVLAMSGQGAPALNLFKRIAATKS